MIAEHESAVLTQDIPEEGLIAGDVGTVVHIHLLPGEAEPAGYMLEFFTLDGDTLAVLSADATSVRPAAANEVWHARSVAAE